MHYALAAGLRAVLERCWPDSMLDPADFLRCRSGLELGFWRNFGTSNSDITLPFPAVAALLASLAAVSGANYRPAPVRAPQ